MKNNGVRIIFTFQLNLQKSLIDIYVSHVYFDVFIIICVNVLPACMFMHHLCSCCPQRSELGIGSPVTGVIVSHHMSSGDGAEDVPWETIA